tara:strand:- start:345 stop:533 length:189 start_codon:yes stop_codon:yes gene_type:complete
MIIVEADSEDEIHRIAGQIGEVCLKHGAVDVFCPVVREPRETFWSPGKVFFGCPAPRSAGYN